MEGLTQAFSNFFNNPGAVKLLQSGIAGAGTVGNLIEEKKRLDYQNFVMSLLKNPGALAQMAAKIQQPLNNGLVQSVDNRVQGDLAARGLSQAPGIFAASEGQALAPFVQQNQQIAMDAVLRSLGLPAGTFGQPNNLAPLFSSLFSPKSSIPAQTPTQPGLTLPTDTTTPPISAGGDMPA